MANKILRMLGSTVVLALFAAHAWECLAQDSAAKPKFTAGASALTDTNQPATQVDPKLAKLAAQPPSHLDGEGWKPLFDGRTLAGWRPTDFAGHGPTHCEAGLLMIEMGEPMTGLNWTNEAPKMNYEIALEAVKLDGSDFFCGLTFPVAESWCSLILGGWGGGLVGLSSIDGQDASENETSQFSKFEKDHWYRVRVRVTPKKIEAWLDQQKIVDFITTDRKISLRFGDIELSKPLGIATYQTTSALRDIKLRQFSP